MKKVIFSIFASLLLILGCQNPSNSEPVIINYGNGTEQKTGMVSGTIILDGMQNDNKGFIITVAGTSLMATTNSKGEFCIGNIPVGKNYEIVIIYGTYTCVWKTNVEVKKNKTNNLGSFEITTEEIKQNSDFQTYAISYELNGGSFTSTPDFVHLYGKTTQLPTPVKTGYGFVGWCTNEDFSGKKITSLSADFNSNIKLYAYWKSGLTVPGGVARLNSFLESLSDVETNIIIITEDFPDLSVIASALKNNSTKKVVLDLSCTSIAIVNNSEFRGVTNLIGIELPESVISIGKSVFEYCDGLTSVTIPSSVTSIGEYAFRDCNNLTKVSITDLEAWCKIRFSNYDSNPLYYAEHLYLNDVEITSLEIPDTVTSIGDYAFSGCSGLTSVTIPSSVTYIDEDAFIYCGNIEEFTVDKNNPKYDSRDDCNGIIETSTNILMTGCKNTIIPSSVTSIGDFAFYKCSGLTSVTIPSSVTSIGTDPFFGCNNLTKVNITDLEAWCKISFSYYDSNPLYYAEHLYLNDVEITSLEIPNTVTSICDYAFFGCYGLTSVTIPSSVTSIGFEAFAYCNNLTKVNITDLEAWCKISFSNYDSNPLYYAEHLYLNDVEITSLEIPDSVTSIGDYAFSYCSGLTSVTIPSSVTSIGYGTFSGCNGLSQITVDKNNPKYDSRDDCNGIIETSTNTLVLGCKNTIIPSSVTSIGYYAFSGCSGLTSVTIPSSVTSIGTDAFSGCSGLTSITIPSSVTSIGWNAFYNCTELQTITFEDTTTWYRTTSSSNWNNKTGGTQTDVSSTTTNTTNFTSNYRLFYWYKL